MIKIKDGKLLYHQTALKNLESIIKNGLLSRNQMEERRIHFTDVANHEILRGRARNHLDNFVPFHFHPRTPFDYRIRGDHPKESFVYIAVKREYAKSINAYIIPAHPLSSEKPEIFSYDEGIKKIDWETMEKKKSDAGYNPQVRMAECLFKSPLKAEVFSIIYVKNNDDKQKVEKILGENNINDIIVNIQENFF